MYVLTIKFNQSATKTYDYLLVNPKGVTIDSGRPLRVLTGTSKFGMSWKDLFVVNKTKMDVLPGWVTAQIVLDDDNRCTTESITAEHLTILRKPKIVSIKPVVKPTEIATVPVVDKPTKPKMSKDEIQAFLDAHRIDPAIMAGISRLNRV